MHNILGAFASKPKKFVFGIPLSRVMANDEKKIGALQPLSAPLFVTEAINWLRENALESEGIFRISGSKTQMDALKESIDRGDPIDFSNVRDENQIAGLLKQFFRELSEPLLMVDGLGDEIAEACKLQDEFDRENALSQIISKLPEPNYSTLYLLISFLVEVSSRSSINKMDSHNLGIVFGPNLLPSAPHCVQAIIDGFHQIFTDPPAGLVTNTQSPQSKIEQDKRTRASMGSPNSYHSLPPSPTSPLNPETDFSSPAQAAAEGGERGLGQHVRARSEFSESPPHQQHGRTISAPPQFGDYLTDDLVLPSDDDLLTEEVEGCESENGVEEILGLTSPGSGKIKNGVARASPSVVSPLPITSTPQPILNPPSPPTTEFSTFNPKPETSGNRGGQPISQPQPQVSSSRISVHRKTLTDSQIETYFPSDKQTWNALIDFFKEQGTSAEIKIDETEAAGAERGGSGAEIVGDHIPPPIGSGDRQQDLSLSDLLPLNGGGRFSASQTQNSNVFGDSASASGINLPAIGGGIILQEVKRELSEYVKSVVKSEMQVLAQSFVENQSHAQCVQAQGDLRQQVVQMKSDILKITQSTSETLQAATSFSTDLRLLASQLQSKNELCANLEKKVESLQMALQQEKSARESLQQELDSLKLTISEKLSESVISPTGSVSGLIKDSINFKLPHPSTSTSPQTTTSTQLDQSSQGQIAVEENGAQLQKPFSLSYRSEVRQEAPTPLSQDQQQQQQQPTAEKRISVFPGSSAGIGSGPISAGNSTSILSGLRSGSSGSTASTPTASVLQQRRSTPNLSTAGSILRSRLDSLLPPPSTSVRSYLVPSSPPSSSTLSSNGVEPLPSTSSTLLPSSTSLRSTMGGGSGELGGSAALGERSSISEIDYKLESLRRRIGVGSSSSSSPRSLPTSTFSTPTSRLTSTPSFTPANVIVTPTPVSSAPAAQAPVANVSPHGFASTSTQDSHVAPLDADSRFELLRKSLNGGR